MKSFGTRLGIDKEVPREEWDRYSNTRTFLVYKTGGSYNSNPLRDCKGNLQPAVRQFGTKEDAIMFLEFERIMNNNRALVAIEELEIKATRTVK